MNSPTPVPSKAPIGSLRALWPFVRRHRGLFVAWLLALAVSSTASLSLPVAFRTMIDDGFGSGSSGGIDRAFLLLFAVAVLLAIGTAARFFFVSLLGERVVADLRTLLYGHLIGLDAGFFDRNRSGELVSRLTADAELRAPGILPDQAKADHIAIIGGQCLKIMRPQRHRANDEEQGARQDGHHHRHLQPGRLHRHRGWPAQGLRDVPARPVARPGHP